MLGTSEFNERAKLREFLINHFDLEDLRNLAFDLHVDFQFLSDQNSREMTGEIARNLIIYFEKRNQISCLWIEILKRRDSTHIKKHLEMLRPCLPRKLVEVRSLGRFLIVGLEEAKKVVASLFGLSADDVDIVAAGRGSIRLLVSIPERAISQKNMPRIHNLGSGWNQVAITYFDNMDSTTKKTWRLLALDYPPHFIDGKLHPVISWQDAMKEMALKNQPSNFYISIDPDLWNAPEILSAAEKPGPRPPENAKEKVTYQLVDLWAIEGYIGNKVQELPDGSLGLVIFINKKQVLFIYDISSNDPIITRIILRNSKGSIFEVSNPSIFNIYTLLEAILKLGDKYGPQKYDSQTTWM